MGRRRAKALFLGGWLLMACSSAPQPSARDVADASDTGRAVTAATQTERELLQLAADLPVGKARKVGTAMVISEAAYVAASGRTCRALHVTAAGSGTAVHRLACNDGKSWFFVPDVFGGNGVTD